MTHTPNTSTHGVDTDRHTVERVFGFHVYRDDTDGTTYPHTPTGLARAADHAMTCTGGRVQLILRVRVNDYVGTGIYRDVVVDREVEI